MKTIVGGSTDQSIRFFAWTTATGVPVAVAHDTSGLSISYQRNRGSVTAVGSLSTLSAANSAHADGGLKHLGSGEHRFDAPDAAFAVNAADVQFFGEATGITIRFEPIQLVKEIEDQVWDAARGDHTIAGSYGEVATKTEIAGSVIDAIDAGDSTFLNSVNGKLDDIKERTDNLPDDPADQSELAQAIQLVDDYVDTEVAAIVTAVGAIKAKTDQLVFGLTNMLDVNVKAINSIASAAVRAAEMELETLKGTVDAGGSSTTFAAKTFPDVSPTVLNQLKDRIVLFSRTTTTAGLRGKIASITATTGDALPTFTVSGLGGVSPVEDDVFYVI